MLASSIKSSFSVGVAALQMATNVDLLASSATTTGANEAQANLFATNSGTFLENPKLHEEVFGPAMLCVATEDKSDMLRVASHLEGHLTATILGTDQDLTEYANLITILERKVGRIIFNGYPTGVEVGG